MGQPLLETLVAQDTARTTLERALARGRVHHAYLFDGPDGVGKELAALGLAQALVCERRAPNGSSACGSCSACERVPLRDGDLRPRHPDVVLLGRALYPAETIGRRTPETQDLSIDQVRTLVLARAAFPPHEGRARVYVMRDADELSPSAANALLKTLEEPPRSTYFVLLSSRSGSLLPTIHSRTLRVRFGPLPDPVVQKLLAGIGVPEGDAETVAPLARGSMSLARTLADPELVASRDAFVKSGLEALSARGIGPLMALAEAAKKDKDQLPDYIRALGERLASRAREGGDDEARFAARHEHVGLALDQLEGNASAQLVVESMLLRMRGA